jgi:hypothetical protein
MIRRSVPSPRDQLTHLSINGKQGQANQFVKKVILSEDMVVALLQSVGPLPGQLRKFGEKHVLFAAITLIKFVTVCSQRAGQ